MCTELNGDLHVTRREPGSHELPVSTQSNRSESRETSFCPIRDITKGVGLNYISHKSLSSFQGKPRSGSSFSEYSLSSAPCYWGERSGAEAPDHGAIKHTLL